MDNSRLNSAVDLLKQCKAQGKTYYEATQILLQQGYNQAEIEQASYEFTYTTSPSVSSNPTSDLIPPQHAIAENKDAELKMARQQVVQDSWYQLIPIIGLFFRLRWFSNFATYESLKTGYSKSTVITLWLVVMLITMVYEIFVPEWANRVNFLANSTLGLYLVRYIGIILAFALLFIIFRAKKPTK